ncbi:MAG: flagellar basal-body rod protein FlgF [Maricaulaceae bacterium]|nr:flagellar basal-body rod protein FlgF [Maricaulaceae bacterium]
MDNALMIGLSRQMTLRRAMDVVANNIANASTAGFKAETLLLEGAAAPRAAAEDGPSRLMYVADWGMGRDFGQGALEHTGRAFDLALEGEGFFALQTADGDTRYTRDGRFRLDSEGRLAAPDGALVLGEGGAPLLMEAGGEPVRISGDGILTQGEAEIGRVAVFRFDAPGALEKTGESRYRAPEGAEALAVAEPQVLQGFVERSNVQPILELTRMMEVMRAYESVSRFINQTEELNRKAIERLGRV